MWAVDGGGEQKVDRRAELVELLLRAGADPNLASTQAPGEKGYKGSPLGMALAKVQSAPADDPAAAAAAAIRVVELLREAGARTAH